MSISFKRGCNANGTSLQGYVNTTYANLVACFGEPDKNFDDYKSDANWDITFADGVVATIYNWKDGKNYAGADGLALADIREWHVGGFRGTDVAGRVRECLNDYLAKGRTVEEIVAKSRPLVKEYKIDMSKFRDALTTMQNTACDVADGIRRRDGSVPADKLIEYTVVAAEAKILDKIVKAMDYCKV